MPGARRDDEQDDRRPAEPAGTPGVEAPDVDVDVGERGPTEPPVEQAPGEQEAG